MSIPDSLSHDALAPLWEKIRQRLDKYGPDRRGTIKLPRLTDNAALILSSLLDKKLTSRINLDELEVSLTAKGVGSDLTTALDILGYPASASREAFRAANLRRADARTAVDNAITSWPETWCEEWVEWLFRSGIMANTNNHSALQLVEQVRRVLDYLKDTQHQQIARNDLAVKLFGSSHALDDSTAIERAARRTLWHKINKTPDYHERRAVWSAAGITTDRVSTPVLSWSLKLHPHTALGKLCNAANEAGIPLHLSTLALEQNEIRGIEIQKPILVVENPRLVEAAAERQVNQTVITTNGNPSNVVIILIKALLQQNIEILYHGDFDAAGIAICKRMFTMGCKPWLMSAENYINALEKASRLKLTLPLEDSAYGDTPWDNELQTQLTKHKLVIHEELLIDEILDTRF